MSQRIRVHKYGGSSVADVGKIKRVARRVADRRAEGYALAVVVSAMGDTTDELLALAKEVTPNPSRRELDMLLTAGEPVALVPAPAPALPVPPVAPPAAPAPVAQEPMVYVGKPSAQRRR